MATISEQSATCLKLLKASENSDKGMIEFNRFQSNLTIASALDCGTQISILKRDSVYALKDGLNILLANLHNNLNAKEKFDSMQAVSIIEIIISNYSLLKFEEIVYALKLGMMGRFGSDYNRVDIMTICTWIDKYEASDEKINYFENLHNKKKKQAVFPELSEMSEENRVKWAEVTKKIEQAEAIKKQKKPVRIEKDIYNSREKFIENLKENVAGWEYSLLIERVKEYREAKMWDAVQIVETEIDNRR